MSAPATSPWDGSGFEPPERDVAVVGMAGRFPGARDLGAFFNRCLCRYQSNCF
jgi:hypothetical protein